MGCAGGPDEPGAVCDFHAADRRYFPGTSKSRVNSYLFFRGGSGILASLVHGDRPRHGFSFLSGVPLMGKKLYVGNLAYGVSDSDLEQLFSAYGTVQSAQVI